MRIASNKLQDIIGFYYAELTPIYGEREVEAMLRLSVEHFLGYNGTDIITRSGDNINQSALIKLYDCCKDLKKHIPIQYILNEAWFYGLRFNVNRNVLIPRPETEELVGIILQENKTAHSLLDIGAGSGCIPIAIKKNLPGTRVSACDVSTEALSVASENARLNEVDVDFFEADVMRAALFDEKMKDPYEVIVSNPPYITPEEMETLEKHVVSQEPHIALFVTGKDPIVFYKKISDLCKGLLKPRGRLYFELNPVTAPYVKEYVTASGMFNSVKIINDMSGNRRFLTAAKN